MTVRYESEWVSDNRRNMQLKSQGAIPTPPEMRGRLKKAGHHGLPNEEDSPFRA